MGQCLSLRAFRLCNCHFRAPVAQRYHLRLPKYLQPTSLHIELLLLAHKMQIICENVSPHAIMTTFTPHLFDGVTITITMQTNMIA